jgi:hypothetical protein
VKSLLLLAVVGVLAGCAFTSRRPPVELACVRLVVASSPAVEVLTPRFKLTDQGAYLEGSVRRAFGAKSTEDSCLQVRFIGGAGAVLSVQIVTFSPAELPPRSTHRYNEGHYLVPIPDLPAGTSQIEITAVSKRNP